ncbi:hypothetical protein NS220_08325 [Microbacterium testaceum]|uniref:Uncharacterized protein n=1 Tax=Microbacterium testaceum TaxID=2033 RepID=A0A147EY83_MICTE|nr:hypothetical protein [Microbacterium testaceum]KTR94658.1 hypothetical protein NS220_08325 [Microbacterium testaceum]
MSATIVTPAPARRETLGAADRARPFLRRDTFYAEADDGVQFASSGPAFHLSGRGSFPVFERIAPFLDGQVSRAELRAALGPAHWPVVERILGHLAERGFLRWIAQEDVDTVGEDDRATYAEQIAFLAQYTDTPHASFATFRDEPLSLVGQCPLGDALAQNLAANGHRDLTVVDTSGAGPLSDDARHAAHLLILPTAEAYAWFARHRGQLDPARCLLVLPVGDRLWVLPHAWRADTRSAPDWKDAVIALEAAGVAPALETLFAAAEEGLTPLQGRAASVQVQRMLGALLSYEIFKGLTGALAPETEAGAISLDATTGETVAHRILPSTQRSRVMSAPASSPTEPTTSLTPDDSRPDDYGRWERLVGSLTMPVTGFADEHLVQLPLKVAVATTGEGSAVRAPSLWTLADARSEAIARVYETLVASLEPSGPLLPFTSFDGERAEIDAARIFRRSRANAAGRYERSAAAIGVALTEGDATLRAVWKAATEHLLLQHVSEPAGAVVAAAPEGTVSTFLADVAGTGDLGYIALGSLAVAGTALEIHVVIATLAADDRLLWHVAAGDSAAAAAAAAATEVIALVQYDDARATTPSMEIWPGIDPRALVAAGAAGAARAAGAAETTTRARVFAASLRAPVLTAADLHAAAAVVLG